MLSKEFKTHDFKRTIDYPYFQCVVCGMYVTKVFISDVEIWMRINQPFVFTFEELLGESSKIIPCNEYLMQRALM